MLREKSILYGDLKNCY